jgi:hypothetical protein
VIAARYHLKIAYRWQITELHPVGTADCCGGGELIRRSIPWIGRRSNKTVASPLVVVLEFRFMVNTLWDSHAHPAALRGDPLRVLFHLGLGL